MSILDITPSYAAFRQGELDWDTALATTHVDETFLLKAKKIEERTYRSRINHQFAGLTHAYMCVLLGLIMLEQGRRGYPLVSVVPASLQMGLGVMILQSGIMNAFRHYRALCHLGRLQSQALAPYFATLKQVRKNQRLLHLYSIRNGRQ